MHIPDDPLYFEKYYFTPGDLGLPLLRHAVRRASARWSAGTSGIPKAARLAALGGAQMLFYPTAIGWHPSEKARVRRGAARRLANHPALARHRQRRLRGGGESRRATKDRRSTGSSSGAARSSPIRSGRCWPKASHDQEEILIVECDPRAHRRSPPQLAVPARPPHRRLRPDPEPGARLKAGRRASRGFRMPAEWEPHEATWIAWPHNRDGLAGPIRADPVGLRRDRAQAQPRWSGCASWWTIARCRSRPAACCAEVGADLDAVEFFPCPTNRVWTRDYGPIFVTNRAGRSRPSRSGASTAGPSTTTGKHDARVPGVPGAAAEAARRSRPDMVLEGGSIDVNGEGLLLTTEECLLSPVQARNPGLSRATRSSACCATIWASTA